MAVESKFECIYIKVGNKHLSLFILFHNKAPASLRAMGAVAPKRRQCSSTKPITSSTLHSTPKVNSPKQGKAGP